MDVRSRPNLGELGPRLAPLVVRVATFAVGGPALRRKAKEAGPEAPELSDSVPLAHH
jgi:hypothetical protein